MLLALGLSSCGNAPTQSSEAPSSTSPEASTPESSATSSAPSKELSQLKDLLSKQDLSPAYAKTLVSRFAQKYDAFSSRVGEDEEEMETDFYTYSGAGNFGCFYEVSESAYEEVEALENPNFFDYLSRGMGSYAMLQTADLVSYSLEVDDALAKNSLQVLDFLQEVEARFAEDTVQVVNSLFTKDTLDGGFDIDTRQYFNGIIDKETLFDTITARALSDIFARTNLFDGQRTCETLDRIYFDVVKELCEKNDAELIEFIDKNDIRFENEEETILVHFKVGDEHLRAILDENDINPGAFEGTLTYEKESGKFTAFDYSILYVTSEVDEKQGYVHSASMEFKANGYSRNEKYEGSLYIDPDPTVYDDAEVFLDDVVREVIPPAF